MALAITGGSGSLSDPYIIDNPGGAVGEEIIGHSSIVWPGRYTSVFFRFSVGTGAGAWIIALVTTSHVTLRGRDTDTTSGWDDEDTTAGNNEISITVQTSDSILFELIQFSEPVPSSVQITITAPTGLSDPTAVDVSAGGDRTTGSGTTIDLAGSANITNPSGATTYAWTRVSGVGGALSSTSVAAPTFTAPVLVAGGNDEVIVWRLTATNNGVSDSDDASVTVVAGAALVTTVTAAAGADKSVGSGEGTSLDGSVVVVNPSGDTIYAWTRVSGVGGALSSAAIAIPTFTAPVLADGTDDVVIVWRLTATNNGVSDTDDVTVTVTAAAIVPVVVIPVTPSAKMSVVVGGIDITDRVEQGTLSTRQSLGEKSTCKFRMNARQDPVSTDPRDNIFSFANGDIWELEDGATFQLTERTLSDVVMRLGTTRLSLLNEVEVVYLTGRTVFGGYMYKARRIPLKTNLEDANINVTCTGYETSLRNQFIEEEITVSGTLLEAITAILTENPVSGLTISSTIPDIAIPEITFNDITIYRAFRQLAISVGLGVAVDTSNVLRFGAASLSRPILLCDLEAYKAADTSLYRPFLVERLELETTASNYANKLTLNSSDILGFEISATAEDTAEQSERGIVSREQDIAGPYTQGTLDTLAAHLLNSYSRHPVRFHARSSVLGQHDDDTLLSLAAGDAVQMNIKGAVNTLTGIPDELFVESVGADFKPHGPDGLYRVNMTLATQFFTKVYADAWR